MFTILSIFFDLFTTILYTSISMLFLGDYKIESKNPFITYSIVSFILFASTIDIEHIDYYITAVFMSYVLFWIVVYSLIRYIVSKKLYLTPLKTFILDMIFISLLTIHIVIFPKYYLDYYLYVVDHFFSI